MSSDTKPFSLPTRLAHNLVAAWKWILSFRTSDWQLSDYPVFSCRQAPDAANAPERLRKPPYMAFILKWSVIGSGETKADAMLTLERLFQDAKAQRIRDGKEPPRPGTRVLIEFASSEGIDTHPALRDDFINRVLELDWAFVSDESSLWDFHTEATNTSLHQRINDSYRVDVSDIESGSLKDIFERICANPESPWR